MGEGYLNLEWRPTAWEEAPPHPPHNCGASPTPRAGLEAVPLPLGLAQASWDPLKWVPGKSSPGPGYGAELRGGAGPQPRRPAAGGQGAPRVSWGHLLPGFRAPSSPLWLPVVTPHFLAFPFPLWPHPPSPLPNKLSLDAPLEEAFPDHPRPLVFLPSLSASF